MEGATGACGVPGGQPAHSVQPNGHREQYDRGVVPPRPGRLVGGTGIGAYAELRTPHILASYPRVGGVVPALHRLPGIIE